MIEPHSLIFRVFTAKVSGVPKFKKLYGICDIFVSTLHGVREEVA